jgi:hypothetical protein
MHTVNGHQAPLQGHAKGMKLNISIATFKDALECTRYNDLKAVKKNAK